MEMTAKLWGPSAMSGGDWRSALLARAPQIVTFILALALAAQLALIVVGFAGRSRQTAPAPVQSAPAAPPLDIGGLVNAHLFGNAVVQNTGDGANAPPSSMPLVLAGVLATDNPKEGMAIIGETAQAAKIVNVGQQVPGGAMLHSVYNDRAIIDRNGALESLLLPRRSAGSVGPPPPPPPTAAAGSNEAMLERMRKLVNDDPGVIGQVLRPQPVFAGGKMRGGLALTGHDVGNGLPDAGLQVRLIDRLLVDQVPHHAREVRRPRQAAGMGGRNAVLVSRHCLPSLRSAQSTSSRPPYPLPICFSIERRPRASPLSAPAPPISLRCGQACDKGQLMVAVGRFPTPTLASPPRRLSASTTLSCRRPVCAASICLKPAALRRRPPRPAGC